MPRSGVPFRYKITWRTPTSAANVGRDMYWLRWRTECWISTRSWLRYNRVPIADRNRCLFFSSSSFEAKSSELTSGVPLGLRCCQPYNVTNSSVYRSWGLTITPASVKRCLFFRNLIGSPGPWSLEGTISPPCKVNLPFNPDTSHSTASRSPPKMRSSTWEHKTKGFSLCLKRLGSSGVVSISRAWRCSQRKSKNLAAACLWPGRHRPKTQYLVFSPSFHQLGFSTKIFSRWGTKRNASLVAAVSYQNQSCTSSWRWSKCRSHSCLHLGIHVPHSDIGVATFDFGSANPWHSLLRGLFLLQDLGLKVRGSPSSLGVERFPHSQLLDPTLQILLDWHQAACLRHIVHLHHHHHLQDRSSQIPKSQATSCSQFSSSTSPTSWTRWMFPA